MLLCITACTNIKYQKNKTKIVNDKKNVQLIIYNSPGTFGLGHFYFRIQSGSNGKYPYRCYVPEGTYCVLKLKPDVYVEGIPKGWNGFGDGQNINLQTPGVYVIQLGFGPQIKFIPYENFSFMQDDLREVTPIAKE